MQTIPLNGGPPDQRAATSALRARYDHLGTDTRTLTDWGTLETRLEGDFGGGNDANATSASTRLGVNSAPRNSAFCSDRLTACGTKGCLKP